MILSFLPLQKFKCNPIPVTLSTTQNWLFFIIFNISDEFFWNFGSSSNLKKEIIPFEINLRWVDWKLETVDPLFKDVVSQFPVRSSHWLMRTYLSENFRSSNTNILFAKKQKKYIGPWGSEINLHIHTNLYTGVLMFCSLIIHHYLMISLL